MTLTERAKGLARGALDVARRGHRTVIWVPPDVNYGNFLYVWLRAYSQQERGNEFVVRHTERMDYWLQYLPLVRSRLVIAPERVRFLDRRELGMAQGWGHDYLPHEIPPFVRAALLESELGLEKTDAPKTHAVMNVRRGDYFSPRFAPRFSYDVRAYLTRAVDRSIAVSGPLESIHVVSDDPAWCREHLSGQFDQISMTFEDGDRTPVTDFRQLCGARRLILTNSTFGYWAAHVSNVLHGDNYAEIVVPWFHDRSVWDGEAYQLNPSWTVVRDLPGGWGPEPAVH